MTSHTKPRDGNTKRISVNSLLSPTPDSKAQEVSESGTRKTMDVATRKRGHDSDQGAPRAPRPSYTEEQKFFIMYARIVQGKAWPDIENDFCRVFGERGERTKGGLTSVYYRIRETWHLTKVLAHGPQSFAEDRVAVERMARGFQPEFLLRIGYPVH